MTYRIRKAMASDTEFAVPLLYISGPNIFRYSYACEGDQLEALMMHQFNSHKTLLSKDYAHVSVDDTDHVTGILLGYPGDEMDRIVKHMTKTIGRTLKEVGAKTFFKMMSHMGLNRYFPKTGNDEYYICNLAVAEEARGQGIGTGLLIKAEALALASGLNKLSLLVEVDNTNAIGLYEHYGFLVTESSLLPKKYHEWGLEGFYKMVKEVKTDIDIQGEGN